MRKIHAAGPLTVALALVSGVVQAQPAGGAGAPSAAAPPSSSYASRNKLQTMVLQKQQLGTEAFAIAARTRMRNGNCAGALDVFDQAVLHSIDPTLRRDRGLCHEQLGHPYPAIEDYRAYLKVQPDAPDAEGIRQRLARLEADSAPVEAGPARAAEDDDVPPPGPTGAAVSPSSGAAPASASAPNDDVPPPDKMDYVEHDNDILRTPLRHGRGFSLEPFFAERKWFYQGASLGAPDSWAECVGLQLRYSLSGRITVFAEGAYERFNSTTGSADVAAATVSGVSTQLGLELRIPLDADYGNQLLVTPGIGYDALSVNYDTTAVSNENLGAVIPRIRAGWRHMLTTSVAFDLTADLGVAKFVQYTGPDPGVTPVLGINAGLAWGM